MESTSNNSINNLKLSPSQPVRENLLVQFAKKCFLTLWNTKIFSNDKNAGQLRRWKFSLVALPLEIFSKILGYLPFERIEELQKVWDCPEEFLPVYYFLENDNFYSLFNQVCYSKKSLSLPWEKAFTQKASTILQLDVSSFPLTPKLIEMIKLCNSLKTVNLYNKKFTTEVVKRCELPQTVEEIKLNFDKEYCIKPLQFSRLHLLEWRHNGPMPSCDYSGMPALSILKVRAQSIESLPLKASNSLTALCIECSEISAPDILKSLQLENFSNLRLLEFNNLLLSTSNIAALLALQESCSALELRLSFVLQPFEVESNLKKELKKSAARQLADACNLLVYRQQGRATAFSLMLDLPASRTILSIEQWEEFFEALDARFLKTIYGLHLNTPVTDTILAFGKKLSIESLTFEEPIDNNAYELLCSLNKNLKNLSHAGSIRGGPALPSFPSLSALTIVKKQNKDPYGYYSVNTVERLHLWNILPKKKEARKYLEESKIKKIFIRFIDPPPLTQALVESLQFQGFTQIFAEKKTSRLYEACWQRL